MEKLEKAILDAVRSSPNSDMTALLLTAALLIAFLAFLLIVYFVYRIAKRSNNDSAIREAENDAYHRGIEKGYSEAEKDYKNRISSLEQQIKNYAEAQAFSKRQEQQRHERWVNKQASDEEKRLQQLAERKAVAREFELQVAKKLANHFRDRIAAGKTRILHTINQPGYFDTEIDLLMIDTSGIYLIECKCWKGLIVGNVNWKYWIQVGCNYKNNSPVLEDGQEFTAKVFYSPIEQVSKQAEKLQDLIRKRIGYTENVYKRMAVMQSSAHIDFIRGELVGWYKDFTWFGTKERICDKIELYQLQKDNLLSIKNVDDIYNGLRSFASEEINAD